MPALSNPRTERRDIHAEITAKLIASIEADPGRPSLPWRRSSAPLFMPENALTKKLYNGINIVSLWVSAECQGYEAPIWATLRRAGGGVLRWCCACPPTAHERCVAVRRTTRFVGPVARDNAADRARRVLTQCGVGGVVLFGPVDSNPARERHPCRRWIYVS